MHSSSSRAFSLLFGCGMLLALTACGDKSDKGDSGENPLLGTWESTCIALNNNTASYRKTASFTSADYTQATMTFDGDGQCQTVSKILQDGGTYRIGKSAAGDTGAREIDFTVAQLLLTPKTQEIADTFNDISNCGITSWQLDQPIDIKNRQNCELGSNTGDSAFDLFKVSGTNLNFGEIDATHDGTTAEKRPVTLSGDLTLQRK